MTAGIGSGTPAKPPAAKRMKKNRRMDGCMTGDVILDAVYCFPRTARRIPGNFPVHVPRVARSDCSSCHVTQPTSPIGRDASSSFALADLAWKGQNACLKAGLMTTEVVLAKEEKKKTTDLGGASNDLRGGSKPRGGQRASDASARRTAPAGNTIAVVLDLSSPPVNLPQIVAGGRMPGNLSLRLSTPAGPVFKGSALPPAPNATSPEWEAPTFTVAARCRVAATLALFVFAALSNLSVLISVRWGRGYRLAAHLRPLIASLASADLLMTFVVMPLDAVWNMTVQWYAGDVLCKLLCFLKLFAMHSVAFILVVVSLDRYRAILHPLDSLDAGLRNKRMLLVAWMLSLLLASPQSVAPLRLAGVDPWAGAPKGPRRTTLPTSWTLILHGCFEPVRHAGPPPSCQNGVRKAVGAPPTSGPKNFCFQSSLAFAADRQMSRHLLTCKRSAAAKPRDPPAR
ncbi:uncharacterized protein LOC127604911 isoform X4 [Hippocampus zosterae]|uniref:uncharacterized protein LOC127604911 isoform X4 n=1 Tax=Hippocampus zosterae TaxID=109293 RepID=UPI00223D1CE1|nr:uncharacterized protein LOC127604911 isoform X4 [Hippocampus zosterae]